MKAIDKFHVMSVRCEAMVTLWRNVNGDPKNPKGAHNHDDLIRAAIVLKVAAMDHYFTNKFMDMLTPFLRSNGATKDLSIIIEESGISFQEAINLLNSDKPFRKIEKKVSYKLNRFVAQNVVKIDSLFKGFGIHNLCESAQGRAKDNRLLRNVNLLIRRRHSIVHDGDLDKKGNTKIIGKSHILKKIESANIFIKNCDEILNSLLSKKHHNPCFYSDGVKPLRVKHLLTEYENRETH